MPKLIFRGAIVSTVDFRYDPDAAASFTRIDFTTDFSDTIAQTMGWNPLDFLTELPPAIQKALEKHFAEHGRPSWIEAAGISGKAGLKGKVAATSIELVPNGELKRHAVTLEANEVGAFSLSRRLDREGNTKKIELHFQVLTTQIGAAKEMEAYVNTVGRAVAQLKVGYMKQDDLDLTGGREQEDEQEEEQLIDEDQAADTKAEAPLASATAMGGTHQRKQKKGSVADGDAPGPVAVQ